MYFEQKKSRDFTINARNCVFISRDFYARSSRECFLKKNETAKQMEVFLISHNGAIFFLTYTEQLIEITVIKRLFGNINIII